MLPVLGVKERMRLLKVLSPNCRNIVLAIESSCDDTCLAILNVKNDIIHEYKLSQKKLHQPFGGVVPQLASQGHRNALQKILSDDRLHKYIRSNKVKYIAVTTGPGIGSCLSAGYEIAVQISRSNNIPLFPINHLLGHLVIVDKTHKINFPRLSLIISGGNTQLVFSRNIISHHILGLTIDDAVGEALDKTARLLNCNWSESGGLGRELEKMAAKGKPLKLNISSLNNYKDPLSFSFSGLKTALKLFIKDENNSSVSQEDLAATIQETLFGQLVDRVKNCFEILKKCELNVKTFSLIGGVASNQYLRTSLENLCKKFDVTLVSPEQSLCTDNAIMIGLAANTIFSAYNGQLQANFPARINPEWNLEELSINKHVLE